MLEQRVLGVDAGASGIKVAQVVSAPFGRQFLSRLALCADTDELTALFKDKAWLKAGDRVHLGFPSEQVVVRRVELPFKDLKKIQRTLPFELEGDVPFQIEEMVTSYILHEKGANGTSLMVIAAKREFVRSWLDRFRPSGLDPVLLEPDITTLSHLIPRGLGEAPRTYVVLDIGASKTNLILFHDDRMHALRVIGHGLGTESTALPLPEGLLQEIQRLMRTLRARGDTPRPQAVFLSGGVAAIPDVAGWLLDQWDLPIHLLKPLDAVRNALEESPEVHPSRFSTAIALALSRDKGNGGLCNLRIDELSYRPGFAAVRRRAQIAGALCILVLMGGLGDLYARVHIKRKSLEAIKSEIKTLFYQVFPKGARAEDAPLQMRRLLDERRNNQLNVMAQDPRGSTVEMLREISLRVQASTRLRLTGFDFSGDVITLRGEADGYNTIEKTRERWQASPLLESVEIKSAKRNPRTGLWDFQCTAKRKFS
jgi:type II secretion system protein L